MEGQKFVSWLEEKKKQVIFIVTVSTLTIQQGRWDNKWAESNRAE